MKDIKNKIFKEALNYAAKYCSISEKCKFDVIKKLKLRELESSQIDEIIDYLVENKYIDEKRYAIFFTRDKFRFQQWGRIKIKVSLFAKNISEKNIVQAQSEILETEYLLTLRKLLIKKNNSLINNELYLRKSKIIRYAVSKGYENEIILKVMDGLL